MIQPAVDLALGRAFTPDAQDTLVPLARRFSRRPLIAVSLYKDGLEAVAVTFEGGAPRFGAAEFCPPGPEDADAAFLRAFAQRHRAKDCLINLATGYTAVLSSRTRRAETDEEALLLMRENPERLLGESPAQGCRHSIAYHPTHSFAVVFAHKEAEVQAAASLASRANLGLARLQCGMASLLMYVLGRSWPEISPEAELLFVDRGAVFYLSASDTGFGRPLFDVGLKEPALKQAIAERVGKLREGGKTILVDSSGLDVAAMLQARGLAPATPLAEAKYPMLLACCSDAPRLGYDLFPGEREVRGFAPARLAAVPVIFWGAIAAAVAVVAVNTVRENRDHAKSLSLRDQARMVSEGKTRNETLLHRIDAKEKTAAAMYDWLRISPPAQALLIRITGEVEAATREGLKENRPVAQVESLSIALQEGQPQMRLVLVLLGDASAANRVSQRISALLSRLGYSTVNLKQALVPEGFRYEHLLNMPKEAGA